MTKVTQLSRGDGEGPRQRRTHLREIVPDMDAPLGTVGQELRGARISRGEDLTTVSRILKIRKDHIEALENDDLSALPGRTYAVGFIRAYADHLGLNPVATVERFKTEIAGRDEPSRNAGFKEDEEQGSSPGGWIFFSVLLLGLIAYGIYYLFSSSAGDRQTSVSAPPARMAQNSGQSADTQNKPTANVSMENSPAPNLAVSSRVYGAANATSRVTLRIKAPTRILVQDEGGAAFINQTMRPGDTYRVPISPKLFLTAEHGSAVQIEVDSKPVALAGNSADASEALALDPGKLAGPANSQAPSPSP
ncbi:MAG: helix-turn-helix domain-containing protein [Alphaproteobacteria bacterium]|nr:helix-turn-helix domain-containing protein [Alphaproteobacteria bacterium]